MSPKTVPKHVDLNKQLLATICDPSIAAPDRADIMLFNAAESGIDIKPSVQTLIQQADLWQKHKQKIEADGENTLAYERFLGAFEGFGPNLYAWVTRGQAEVCVPTQQEQIKGLQFGDAILVDTKTERIVGADGQLPVTGDIVTVESKPADEPSQIVVKFRDEEQLARLHHSIDPDQCLPGARVVYDPVRRFVLKAIESKSDGTELLVPLDRLQTVRREDVGAPRPIANEILDIFRRSIEHPEWTKQMMARDSCSYIFAGATGCGKSFHMSLIATEAHDLIEHYTGERTSRVVMLDASQFWTSYFGETEQRIAAWADKIQALGSQTLVARDGSVLKAPIFVVLEECEALLRSRGEQQGGSSHLFDRPLSLLLQKTQSLESTMNVPIIWVGLSNRPDLADPSALRRMGLRQVVFNALRASEALSVLEKKVPSSLPMRGDDQETARTELVSKVIGYLFGPEPDQGIATVVFSSNKRRTVNRNDVVTPAIIEEAVSWAIDRCLSNSTKAGRLLGLDGDDVVGFLQQYFVNLARTLRPHNVAEHCPEWFQEEPMMVTDVVPLLRRKRHAASLLTRLAS